jgi:predicted nucleic acid-binding protein
MIIISDTSIITNLMQVGKVEILPAAFGQIIIPEAVFKELATLEDQLRVMVSFQWLEVRAVNNATLVSELCQTLDIGEAEAIVLALESHADYLLMDERKGRGKAKEFGIPVTGLLGVLLKAKVIGVLPAVRPVMDELISLSGFHIHRDVYDEVIRLAQE